MRRMVCVVTANISGSRSAFSMTKRATRKSRLGKLPGYILRHSGPTRTVTDGLMLVSLRWCRYFSIQSVVKASLVSLNKEEAPPVGTLGVFVEEMKYRIVTTGEIHSGFSLQEVQKNLGGLCKYDKDKLERIFCGDLFVFESDIDLIAARRYKSSLDQTGIVCQIEPLTSINIKQEQTNHAPASLPAPASPELSECPKCGAPYNGEEACSSCGVIPSKYLERLELEQQVQ